MPAEAVRGVPWTLLTYAATRAVTILTTLVLARMLAPSDLGLFAMATLGMELLSVFSGLWLTAGVIVRPDLSERGQGTVLTLVLAAGAAMGVALVAAAPALAAFFGEPRLTEMVPLLAVVLLFSGVNWFYETVLQRELAFRRRFVCQVVRTLAFAAVALTLAALGAGVWSLVLGYVAGHAANGLALLALTPQRVRPAFDPPEARRTVRAGRGFLGQDLADFLSENADYLAIGRILGPAQLGVYSMAYRQATLPHYAIAEPVGKVTFPAFARMRHRGEDVASAFLGVLRMIALVVCPLGVILSAAAVPFTLTLLGEPWRPMAAPLAVLGIWAALRPLTATVGYLLNSVGQARVYGRIALVALLPLVAGTFVAAAVGGTSAVAWVLVLHVSAILAVLLAIAARLAGVPRRAVARALWPFAAASVVSWIVAHALAVASAGMPPVVSLCLAGFGALAIYLLGLTLLAPRVLGTAVSGVRRVLARSHRVALPRPHRSAVPAVSVAGAALLGAVAGVEPKIAFAAVAGGLLVALAFVAPVAHLLLLIAITAIVPFDVQNALAFGGGTGRPGLFISDVLLMGGLARAVLVLLDMPLQRRSRLALAMSLGFMAVAVAQAVHGVRLGHEAGTSGVELRVLMGFATAVIALPILADRAARGRLLAGLAGVGLAIALWGIAQWTVDIPFTAAQDAGVRAGVRFTTSGRGQIQGGLFAFGVVVVMGAAALLSHELRSVRIRAVLVAVVALASVDLLLTYERTFWVATLLALVFIALRAAPRQRLRALTAGPALLIFLIAVLAVLMPGDVAAARQRLASLGQYGSDLSVRFRLTETRHVMQQIDAHPLAGSGLGATILWGRPYDGVAPTIESFSHNGYLWLVWKLGIPGAAPLLLLLCVALLSRGPPPSTGTVGALRSGAQASLLLLLIASLTFPAFNTLGITAVMGLLIALCAWPTVAEARS
jgi:O-antigen/teichoic acid export membrane protein